jgi:hypothetical protein
LPDTAHPPSAFTRGELARLAAILAGALLVRLAGIGGNLSHDEGYSWLVAHAPTWHGLLARMAAYENTPPLSYVLLRPLPEAGVGWLRVPALLGSMVALAGTYFATRRALGVRAALFAGLLLAIAPYDVSFANYSRGFMPAGGGLALALWAAVELAWGGSRRWWGLWVAGATVALYSEYYSALFLLALGLMLLWARPARVRETLVFGLMPVVAFAPWLGQVKRGLDAVDATKALPAYPGPTPDAIRDVVTKLSFGEHGAATAAGGRWVQFALLAGLIAWGMRLIARSGEGGAAARRRTTVFFPGLALAVLVLHGVVALAGPDIFAERYLTAEIPFVCILAGVVLASLGRRARITAVVLIALAGLDLAQHRASTIYEPSTAPLRAYVERQHAGTVLTNSAVVVYALRRRRDVDLDRAFGLGPGDEHRCRAADHLPLVIVDDRRLARGARTGPGPRRSFGPFVVRTPAAAATRAGCR